MCTFSVLLSPFNLQNTNLDLADEPLILLGHLKAVTNNSLQHPETQHYDASQRGGPRDLGEIVCTDQDREWSALSLTLALDVLLPSSTSFFSFPCLLDSLHQYWILSIFVLNFIPFFADRHTRTFHCTHGNCLSLRESFGTQMATEPVPKQQEYQRKFSACLYISFRNLISTKVISPIKWLLRIRYIKEHIFLLALKWQFGLT